MPSYSGVWNLNAVYQARAAGLWPPPLTGDIGIFSGGFVSGGTRQATLDYVTITTTGNAAGFGDLARELADLGSCSSSTRGLFGLGEAGNPVQSRTNTVSYVTITTKGNSATFGELTLARNRVHGACSNETRGIWAGGYDTGNVLTNVMDYVTIATTGNGSDFGDLTTSLIDCAGCASTTRGVFSGGVSSNSINIIQYITIASTGNATDFGDLLSTNFFWTSSCSSSTRGLIAGGLAPGVAVYNTIEYITIASTGNATDFGDLTVSRYGLSATSNSTRGIFGGGDVDVGLSNVIDYVTIASTGNATDFGDLTVARYALGACSNAHGGL